MCPATRPDSPRQVAEPAPALRTPVAAVGILTPDRERLSVNRSASEARFVT